ncbi:MAG TPA: CHAT domain-containing protein [Gemmataceae bacterium]|nr:CHAT domain-containing protein [Gemmataceae bacterium]
MVGVSDYSKANPAQPELAGARDAQHLLRVWGEQGRSTLYEQVKPLKPLLDGAATPEAIRKQLEALRGLVKPDDQFVLFLAGHGYAEKDKKTGEYRPGSFYFVGPRFDVNKVAQTALSSKDLYQDLAKLRCHQLVLLDACHSGDVASNPLQDLRLNGVGAVILTACKNSQEAFETRDHGLFLAALDEALGADFKADRNRDGVIEPSELAGYVIERVPQLLREVDDTKRRAQDPQVSPRAEELAAYLRPLAKKPIGESRGGTPPR